MDNANCETTFFLPGILLGSFAGVGVIFYCYQVISWYLISGLHSSSEIISILVLAVFSGLCIWLGVTGQQATYMRAPFYVSLVIAILNVVFVCWSIIQVGGIMHAGAFGVDQKAVLPMPVLNLLSSILPVLAILFYLLKRNFACKGTAILTLLIFCFFMVTYQLHGMDFASANPPAVVYLSKDGFIGNAGIICWTSTLFFFVRTYPQEGSWLNDFWRLFEKVMAMPADSPIRIALVDRVLRDAKINTKAFEEMLINSTGDSSTKSIETLTWEDEIYIHYKVEARLWLLGCAIVIVICVVSFFTGLLNNLFMY